MDKLILLTKLGIIAAVVGGIVLTVIYDDMEFVSGGIIIAFVLLFGTWMRFVHDERNLKL